ncbi:MAG: class I SAM-dependent methyltransferase [Vicinamibacterales bacterium]
MNTVHRWLCGSRAWRHHVEGRLLPWALAGVDLGAAVLELGPGPGRTTRCLSGNGRRVTAVEVDGRMARELIPLQARREVTVVQGDASALPFADAAFDTVVAFTMLHHLPSADLQDRVFAETARVLRHGGLFAGTDGRAGLIFRLLHAGDTITVVPPDGLGRRLEAAGFVDVEVETSPGALRFRAWRPPCSPTVSPAPSAAR